MKDFVEHPTMAFIWAIGLFLSLLAPQASWLLILALLSSGYHVGRLRRAPSTLLKTATILALLGIFASSAHLLVGSPGIIQESTFLIARMTVASSWTLGLAAAIDPIALRRRLRDIQWFRPFAEFLDATVFHGAQLADQWQLRLEAARQRGARWRGPAALGTLGLVLGRGAIVAFDRSLALEQTRWLRSAPTPDRDAAPSSKQTREQTPKQTPEKILELHDLSAGYRIEDASIHVDHLTVHRGEWIALAGASGSGKTSLLRLVAGLLDIHGGSLHRFQETHADGQAGPDRRIAMVLQNPDHQFLGSTPRDDLQWGLRQHQIEGDEATRRIEEVLDNLAIADLADRPLGDLSFGQRRLVALASALVTRPQLLLCDEITSSLDPLNKSRVIQAIEALSTPHTTVLWATHDLQTMPPSIERLAILRQGYLHFDGSIADGLSQDTLESAHLIAPTISANP